MKILRPPLTRQRRIHDRTQEYIQKTRSNQKSQISSLFQTKYQIHSSGRIYFKGILCKMPNVKFLYEYVKKKILRMQKIKIQATKRYI